MKVHRTLFASVIAMFMAVAATASPVEVIPTRHQNLFVFTTKKAMRGAEVKVFHAGGDLVTSQRLHKRKMIIDFCDVKAGTYTIVVQKGKAKEEFQYVKK